MIREEEWVECKKTIDPELAAIADKYPPTTCYRSAENPKYHYVIGSYYTDESQKTMLVLVHGQDSTQPGIKAFGQDPAQLTACGCGAWEWPTREQVAERQKDIARIRQLNGLGPLITPLGKYDLEAKPEGSPRDDFDPDEQLLLYMEFKKKGAFARAEILKGGILAWLHAGGYEPQWHKCPGTIEDFLGSYEDPAEREDVLVASYGVTLINSWLVTLSEHLATMPKEIRYQASLRASQLLYLSVVADRLELELQRTPTEDELRAQVAQISIHRAAEMVVAKAARGR